MQKYDDFTREQLDRIDEVMGAFEYAINVLFDIPEDIRKKYNIEPGWDKNSQRGYAWSVADKIADELTDELGVRIYFPWSCDETGVHDMYNEED